MNMPAIMVRKLCRGRKALGPINKIGFGATVCIDAAAGQLLLLKIAFGTGLRPNDIYQGRVGPQTSTSPWIP